MALRALSPLDALDDYRFDAASVVTIFIVLRYGIPSTLVYHPLGAAGTPAGIFSLLMLAAWFIGRLVPWMGLERGYQPIRVGLTVLVMASLVSYLRGVSGPLDAIQWRGVDRALLNLAGWAGVALVTADGIDTRERLDAVIRRIVVLGSFVAMVGMLQFWTGFDLAARIRIPGLSLAAEGGFIGERSIFRRVAGTAAHPIEFGVVMATLLPLAIYVALESPGKRPKLDYVRLCMIAMVIPMTVSRSAILALATGFLCLLFGWRDARRRSALMWAGIGTVAMRLLVPGLIGTIRSLFANLSNDPSISGRTDDYALIGQLVDDNFWIGIGYGTYTVDLFPTLDNQFLLIFIETGYVGVMATILTLLIFGFTARGARRLAIDQRDRELGQVLFASILAMSLTLLTYDGLTFPMAGGTLFLLAGLAGAHWRLMTRAAAERKRVAFLSPPPAPAAPRRKRTSGQRASSTSR